MVAPAVTQDANQISVDQLNSEGLAHRAAGRIAAARRAYRQAVVLLPGFVPALGNLANLEGPERPEAAYRGYRRALCVDAGIPALHLMLGTTCWALGLADAGESALQQALRLDPGYTKAYFNLGSRAFDEGRVSEAQGHFRRGLAVSPGSDALTAALARLAARQGAPEAARTAGWRTIAVDATSPEAIGLLIAAAAESQCPPLGQCLLRRLLTRSPADSDRWRGLGEVMVQGALAALSADYMRRAIACNPFDRSAHLSLLAALKLIDGMTGQDELAATRRYVTRFLEPLAATTSRPRPTPRADRRLRVGYMVGPTACFHTSSMTILPLLEQHDRHKFETVCYSDLAPAMRDDITERYRRATRLVNVRGQSDEEFARQVLADGIDILVDVVGIQPGSRLGTVVRRPAAIQVSFLTCGSLGLVALPWVVADSHLIPFAAETAFSELIVRIDLAFCYDPLIELPPPSPSPAGSGRPVTFGSANQIVKISDACLDTWARVLCAVPNARLLLKGRGLQEEGVFARIRDSLARAGVDPSRIEERPWSLTIGQHLAFLAETDIALDSFPFSGVITTCEALMMGVPVVHLDGDRVLGRYGGAFLRDVGLADLAAASPDQFVEAAARLAHDTDRLVSLRSSLRERMRTSRLCDGRTAARAIEAAYRRIWDEECSRRGVS
jgi:tetratricopeptide (TPR) repeat protein/glycosyltransferase involved in cell wall biosynthesis